MTWHHDELLRELEWYKALQTKDKGGLSQNTQGAFLQWITHIFLVVEQRFGYPPLTDWFIGIFTMLGSGLNWNKQIILKISGKLIVWVKNNENIIPFNF